MSGRRESAHPALRADPASGGDQPEADREDGGGDEAVAQREVLRVEGVPAAVHGVEQKVDALEDERPQVRDRVRRVGCEMRPQEVAQRERQQDRDDGDHDKDPCADAERFAGENISTTIAIVKSTLTATSALMAAGTSTKNAGKPVTVMMMTLAAVSRAAARLPVRHARMPATIATAPRIEPTIRIASGGPSSPSGAGKSALGRLATP